MPPRTSSTANVIGEPVKNGGTSASADTPGLKKYAKRPYAHACAACKARKIKCEEPSDPPCKGCRASNLLCEMPARNVRRKRKFADTDGPSTPRTRTPLTVEDRLARIERVLNLQHNSSTRSTPARRSDASDSEEEGMEPPQFHLGGKGDSIYHGETSMHEAVVDPSLAVRTDAMSAFSKTMDYRNWTEPELRAMARLRHKYATPEEGEALMDAFFSWASMTYGFVNRGLFLRDMALDGPNFSQLLLVVTYLSGLRFSPNMTQEERDLKSAKYMKIANGLIVEELEKPSSIVTAQALLALAGRQCSVGQQTQAWLFTGLAIRMVQDLGIHLAIDDPSLDAHFPQEIKEMRTRLYWSAYCWDKTISLGMGREPALTCRPDSFPEVKLNDAEDDWVWRPFFPGGAKQELLARYPHRTTRTNMILRYFSHLNIILESILVNMYSPHRPNARSVSFIRSTDEKLLAWRRDLPEEIRIDRTCLPDYSGNSNVTVLNLLYFAVRILLYRPLLTVQNQPSTVSTSSFEICRSAAIDIHEILSLWGRTYGHVNMVYLIMYCTFVAAGIDVILLRLADGQIRDEALKRVHLSLGILEHASDQGPGIRRGIQIIASQLEVATLRMSGDAPTTISGSSLAHAESSLRRGAHTTIKTATAPIYPYISVSSQPDNITALPAAHGQAGDVLDTQKGSIMIQDLAATNDVGSEFPPLFDDPSYQQAIIAELLGESQVGTDDPFAFFSSEGWGDAAF